MTDRLTTLLHAEGEALEIPSAPATEILAEGRRKLRVKRRTTAATAAAALAVTVIGLGGSVLGQRHSPSTGPTGPAAPSTTPSPTPQVSWAAGDSLYLGDGSTRVQLPEVAQSLYYTSAGLLVRTNRDGSSDGGAPFHFSLVTRDGTTTKLTLALGEVVPSADPNEPYLAWATQQHGSIQVVVHDVSSDRDVARVDVPGTFSWGGWQAPPVALVGDQVYVGLDDRTEVVDWRTGATSVNRTLPGTELPDVRGTSAVVQRPGSVQVVDVTSGTVLLDLPEPRGTFVDVELSPDGRFATTSDATSTDSPAPVIVHDLERGTSARLPGSDSDYGWSAGGGDLFRVEGHDLLGCDAESGECHDSSVPRLPGGGGVRYPGVLYES
jgi:dipeptidyl aminopeptidase/acylaminoacyl peptidase